MKHIMPLALLIALILGGCTAVSYGETTDLTETRSRVDYEFLFGIDIDNLHVRYSDGTSVDELLFDEIVSKLDDFNFNGVLDLMFEQNLSVLVLDRTATNLTGANQARFSYTSPHVLTCTLGSGVEIECVLTSQGVIHFEADGTITPIGNPTIRPVFSRSNWSTTSTGASVRFARHDDNRTVRVAGNVTLEQTSLSGLQNSRFFFIYTHNIASTPPEDL